MKKMYTWIGKMLGLVLFLLTVNVSAQSWTDLGNPMVGGDPINQLFNIEGHSSGLYLCTDKGLFVSTNDGASFTNLTWMSGVTANEPIRCLYIDDSDGNMYACGETTIFKSTNGGSTWSATGLSTIAVINDIGKGASNIVVAFGDFTNGGALYSSDGFATSQSATGLPNLQMLDLFYYENIMFLAGDEGMYASTDDGLTWTAQGTGHPADGRYLKTLAQDTSLFAGDINGKGLYKSTDTGATWSPADAGTFAEFCQVFDLAVGGGYLFATVDGVQCSPADIAIRFSDDNGVTWNSGLFNIPQAFYDELGYNDGCFYVYAPFEDSLYSSCDLPLAVSEFSLEAIVQVFPNPAQTEITISGQENGTIRILNSQGVLIDQIEKRAASTKIDISRYASGMYILLFESATATNSFKVIKE